MPRNSETFGTGHLRRTGNGGHIAPVTKCELAGTAMGERDQFYSPPPHPGATTPLTTSCEAYAPCTAPKEFFAHPDHRGAVCRLQGRRAGSGSPRGPCAAQRADRAGGDRVPP